MISTVAVGNLLTLERQHKNLCYYVKENTKWKEALLFHHAQIKDSERFQRSLKTSKANPYNVNHLLEKKPFALAAEIAILYAGIHETHDKLVNGPKGWKKCKGFHLQADRYIVLLEALNTGFQARIDHLEREKQTINKMIDHLSVQGLESPETFHNFTFHLLFQKKFSINK